MGGRGSSSMSSSKSSTSQALSPEQALTATNPNYSSGYEYRVNCQRVVYAYEMNRRGELCEAKPKPLTSNGRPDWNNDETGKHWDEMMEGQTWDRVGSRSRPRTIDNLDNQMASYGEGSRAVVYVKWSGSSSAHVFNAERIGGETRYFDAQTGKVVDISHYIGNAMPTKTMVSRIDNLRPSRYIDGCITRR